MNFTSDRTFQLWSYTPGHSFLLLRSNMLLEGDDDYTEKRSYNIDIEFSNVTYIELPGIFRGISVAKAVTDVPERIIAHLVPGNKIFTIGTDSEIYYVIGGSVTIGKNRWLEETRLINPYLEYDKVLAIF